MDNDYKDLLELDKTFPHFHDVGKFYLSNVIPVNVKFDDQNGMLPQQYRLSELLTKYGYATITSEKSYQYYAELTDKGRDAKQAGGHFAYQKKLADKEHIEKEAFKYDFLQKKFIYKARYLPYIISAGALIVSVLAYFKPDNKQAKDQLTTQPTQDTAQAKSETESLLQPDTTLKTKDTLRNR